MADIYPLLLPLVADKIVCFTTIVWGWVCAAAILTNMVVVGTGSNFNITCSHYTLLYGLAYLIYYERYVFCVIWAIRIQYINANTTQCEWVRKGHDCVYQDVLLCMNSRRESRGQRNIYKYIHTYILAYIQRAPTFVHKCSHFKFVR